RPVGAAAVPPPPARPPGDRPEALEVRRRHGCPGSAGAWLEPGPGPSGGRPTWPRARYLDELVAVDALDLVAADVRPPFDDPGANDEGRRAVASQEEPSVAVAIGLPPRR